MDMDLDSVEALLSAWDLEHLVSVFIDQKISLHLLETIDGGFLKELIPVIGDRLRFVEKRNEYFQNKRHDASKQSSSLEPQSFAGSSIQVLALRPMSTNTTTTSTTTSTSVSIARSSHSSLPSTSSQASTSASESNGSCSQSTSTSFVKRVAAQFCLNKFIADIDIKAVCEKHIDADGAIKFYAENSFITGSHRTAIVNALMNHLFIHAREFGCTDSIKNDHLSIFADRIVNHFPGEKKSTYYIPPAKKATANGKLTHKLRNIRRRQDTGKSSNQRFSDESLDIDDPAELIRSAPRDPNVDVEAAINFLAFTRSPWPEVEKKWALTHQHRLQQLQAEPYLNQYFESWPVLQTPTGCSLLEADFNSIWPGRDVIIFSKWPQFEEKILKLAETDVKDKPSRAIFNLLKPNISSDSRAAIALSLLPALCIPTQKLKLPNRKLWCPSIAESRSSIILHAQNANKVRSKLKEHTDQVYRQGQRVQPLIIVVGPSLDKITKSYVCVDKVLWATSCVMKSIDLCFKAVFATETHYPAESQHLWEAIQKCIYKIRTKHDKYDTPLDNIV